MLEAAPNARDILVSTLLDASVPHADLDRVLDQHEAAVRDDAHVFAAAFGAALKASNFDAGSKLIGQRWGVGNGFKVDFQDTGHYEALKWEVSGRNRSRLSLSSQWRPYDIPESFLLRLVGVLSLLTAYCRSDACEAGAVMVNIGDLGHVPGLCFSDYRADYFLIPDAIFLLHQGYEELRRRMAASSVAWDGRKPIAIWRGGTSGEPADPALGWRSLPRIRLCEIGRERQDLFDVGISHAVQYAKDEDVRVAGFMRPHVLPEEFGKYKYQIDIDGNTNSWPGLFQKLLTGSPVLKVASPQGYRQWYYGRLKPWVNFVPVLRDMSDLIEKLLWLKSHDDAARRIGEAGRELADDLAYRGEIERSGRIVTAAMRYFAQRPEIAFRFGIGEKDNQFLIHGWGNPDVGSVPAVGRMSAIVAPRPIAAGDFDLSLDVSPFLRSSARSAQEIGIVVNGQSVCREDLADRKVVACKVPADLIERFDDLNITVLHPRVVALASAERPLDRRTASIAVHALSLEPARPKKLPLLSRPATGPAGRAAPVYLRTHHGRLVGANDEGQLVQLDATDAARKSFVALSSSPDAGTIGSGPLAGFRVVIGENGLHFEKDGLFLCAEPQGPLVANREAAGAWETFAPVSLGDLHPLMLLLHGCDVFDGVVPAPNQEVQGWNSYAPVFGRAIAATKPSVIIDVGVWKGASTLELCRLQREHVENGAVIAVDTFLESPEHFGQDKSAPRRNGFPLLYQEFLANVVGHNMQRQIIPMPQTSRNAASILAGCGIRAGLVHIDAAHDYLSVLSDAREYWRLLEPGGWLIGDDYDPSWPDVVRAANDFAAETGADILIEKPKWIMRKG